MSDKIGAMLRHAEKMRKQRTDKVMAHHYRPRPRQCPACRGYELERQWCNVCKGYGVLIDE